MRAKVRFMMADRREFEFVVEGNGQTEFYDLAVKKLDDRLNELADIVPGTPPPEFFLIESWQTIPEVEVPGMDKTDGVATRSPLQKIRFDLVPIVPMIQIAKVFTFGAYQYGDRNWEAGFSYSRCIGSIWRHFMKWLLGEDYDDESTFHHLAHVVANCMFLMEYAATGNGKDDRRKASPEFTYAIFQPVKTEIEKPVKEQEHGVD